MLVIKGQSEAKVQSLNLSASNSFLKQLMEEIHIYTKIVSTRQDTCFLIGQWYTYVESISHIEDSLAQGIELLNKNENPYPCNLGNIIVINKLAMNWDNVKWLEVWK